jgi:hypothetical protein
VGDGSIVSLSYWSPPFPSTPKQYVTERRTKFTDCLSRTLGRAHRVHGCTRTSRMDNLTLSTRKLTHKLSTSSRRVHRCSQVGACMYQHQPCRSRRMVALLAPGGFRTEATCNRLASGFPYPLNIGGSQIPSPRKRRPMVLLQKFLRLRAW